MRAPRIHLAGVTIAAALVSLAARAASAEPCTSTRPGTSVSSLSEPWRTAFASLLEALAMEGQPWSCAGGGIDLSTHKGGATLTVEYADGRSVARDVSSPDEVVPLGEALLMQPLPPVAPATSDQTPAAETLEPQTKTGNERTPAAKTPDDTGYPKTSDVDASTASAPPRALLSALVMPRYAGKSSLLLGGIEAHGAIPFGPWHAGAWVRYDALSASLDGPGGSLSEVCVGASAGRSFSSQRIELRLSAIASAAIVTAFDDRKGDETRVDGRFGAEARGLLVVTPLLRAVAALDAEIVPIELGRDKPRGGPDRGSSSPDQRHRPQLPSYTIGFGVGMELALR